MRKSRSRVLLVKLVVFCFLLSAFGESVYAGEEFQNTAIIESPEPQSDSFFGFPVDVYGDIMVIGESWASVEGLQRAGKAHIFDLEGNLARAHIFDTEGNLLVTLHSSEPEASALFGRWVDTSGDLVLVAEPSANGESIDEGRAYVFDPEGNLLATLSAPEPTPRTEFGNLVFLKGEVIAVMEYGAAKVGKLYIFQPGASPSPSPSPSPEPERPGGIPGFNIESILVGMLLSVLLIWYFRR